MDGFERLLQGNRDYAGGKFPIRDVKKAIENTKNGQKPFAIIVTCSDSRVVPEFIFGTNLGELFIIRTAGNIVDAITLGSIEYAAEHLQVPLLVVMGHEKCGAVAAACSVGHAEGNIQSIVDKIAPAVKKSNNDVENVVIQNVKDVIEDIRKRSKIVSHLEHEGKITIRGMKYYVTTGNVEAIG